MSKSNDNSSSDLLVGLPWIMIGDTLNVIFEGYVLSKIWHWFIAPLGVREINIPMAIGIAIVIRFLTDGNSYRQTNVFIKLDKDLNSEQTTLSKAFSAMCYSLFKVLICWLSAYIVHLFL